MRERYTVMFQRHFPDVVRFIRRRVSAAATAEDIAADVFLVAWTKFDPEKPFDRPWFYRTALNKVMNHWSRVAHNRDIETAFARLAQEPPSPGDILDRLAVEQALARLRPREAEAIRLTEWEGLDASEVASVLTCSVQAVWKLLSRGRATLRQLLSDADAPSMDAAVRTLAGNHEA